MIDAAMPIPVDVTTTTRTSLLVSVRSAAEAATALAGGADWIDLKEPRRGALGAVDAAVARKTVPYVAGKAPVTAAAGELLAWRDAPSRDLLAVEGVHMLKLGLAGCEDHHDWQSLWRVAAEETAAAGKRLVAVAYADAAAAEIRALELIELAAQEPSVYYLLVDTFDKRTVSLTQLWRPDTIHRVFQHAKSVNLQTVAAGSLSLQSIAELPLELIDVVAVRGAVCQRDRIGTVDETLVRALCGSLKKLIR